MGTVVSKQCYKMDVLEAALMETLNTPTLSLKLENPYRTFRTAREIEKDGHGNYISGVIEFNPAPKSDEVFRLELSLVPAEDASQNSHGIHPNLLSITIKDKNKRIKYRGNLTNPKAWKLVLLITNGQVYYQDHEGNLLKADDLVNGNKLLLGNYAETGMEHVLITVVTPLKTKGVQWSPNGGKVVEDRLLNDKNRWGSQSADGPTVTSISKEFTFGESKRELHRCRLRACLYQDKTDDFKVSEAYTETINDTRDKNFGNFKVGCMSEPHGACEKGGWKHFLITKSRVATSGFYPRFVFASSANDIRPQTVDSLFKGFKQISHEKEDMEIFHNSTFKFKIPNQQRSVIQAIKHYHLNTYVTLYREADDQFAQDMIRFDYHNIHDETDPDSEEECPYCQIKKNQPLNELLKNNLAIQRKRKRRDRNDSSYESGSNLGSPLSIIADHDENSTAPRAIALSVPGPIQTLPTLNWNDEDFNQIVNPPTNCAPTFVMDFGLEEFGTNPGNVMDGPLVKDGGESNTETVTDSEIDSDSDNSDYESSETESNNDSCSNDEEEYRVVEQLDELCNGTNALKMDE